MRQQTEREPVYMYDGGEEKGKPGKPVPDFILDTFKDKDNPVEEQAKMAKNAEDRMNVALTELNKIKQGEATRKLVLGEKDETIEELKKRVTEVEKPAPIPSDQLRYNVEYVKQYCNLHGIYDEEGSPDIERGVQALDFTRAMQHYDREMERVQGEKVLNTREIDKQWNKLVGALGEEFVAERGPEIRAAFKEYPELVARAHRDEKALTQIVRIANAEYGENKAALEEEEEELEKEKLRGQIAGSGKLPAEREKDRARFKGMDAKEIAEEIGFADPNEPSHFV